MDDHHDTLTRPRPAGPDNTGTHPVLGCLAGLDRELSSVATVDPMFMSTSDKRTALVEVRRQRTRLEALELRLVAASGDVAAEDGDPNVAAWLSPRVTDDPAPNHRLEKLARRTADRWTRVGAGLTDGTVSTSQAHVIVHALDTVAAADLDLPHDLRNDLLDRAEAALVAYAATFNPARLRVLGRRILSVVAPDLVDDEERKRLEEEERRARAQTRLTITNRRDGTVDIKGRLSHLAGLRLKTVLESFTSPRHHDGANPLTDPATGAKVPHDQRLGIAFQAFLESLDPDKLPTKAGAGTSLVVTVDYDLLQQRLGIGTLPDGERISPAETRRLACNGAILPAVLDGKSQVLDLGRARRFYSRSQRIAKRITTPSCQAYGCTVPADWCEAHHKRAWAHGGRTDLDDLVLLCPWHHHCADNPDYLTEYLPDGDVRFHRRT